MNPTDLGGRIVLAEAMGWKRGEVHTVAVKGHPISAQRWIDPNGDDREPTSLPNPFTNANDDYAVLQWVRQEVIREQGLPAPVRPRWTLSDKWWPFFCRFHEVPAIDYQIGDFARAALNVIRSTEASKNDD